jgi:hypothetical protein
MQHITEIVPDLDTLPEWAREAFHDGQFFAVALARVDKLEKHLAWIDKKAAEYGYSGFAFVVQNRGNRPTEDG